MSRCTRGGIAPDEKLCYTLLYRRSDKLLRVAAAFSHCLIVQPVAHSQGSAISAFSLSVIERFSNDITAYSRVFRTEDLKSATNGSIGSTSVCLQGFRI
jgi:hypothetical protein